MGKIGIIGGNGIEELLVEDLTPKFIFGFSDIPSQKKERRSIGNSLRETGFKVYSTDTLWPSDSYISNNGLVIPEKYFGRLGENGYYIFGDGFVFASEIIGEDLQRKIRDSPSFQMFFKGSELIIVPPYKGGIVGTDGNKIDPWHLDLTIGYVPEGKIMTASQDHFFQETGIFEHTLKNFELSLRLNEGSGLQNNYYSFRYNGQIYIIANKSNSPFKGESNGFKHFQTKIPIENLPGKFLGSVKCAVNSSPTTKLWDVLGISYKPWGPEVYNYS